MQYRVPRVNLFHTIYASTLQLLMLDSNETGRECPLVHVDCDADKSQLSQTNGAALCITCTVL